MSIRPLGLAVALTLLPALAAPAVAGPPPLIPRDLLFGNPARTAPQLAPDGRRLAWLAPDQRGVLQVWVQSIGKSDARALTADPRRGIRRYQWALDGRHILYLQDTDGDENWHVHGVVVENGQDRDFTPFAGIQAQLVGLDPDRPDQVLVALNLRDRSTHDVHRLTLSTGALVLDTRNPGDVTSWMPDAAFAVRGATVQTADGGTEIRVRDRVNAPWRRLVKVGPDEILSLAGFSADGRRAILTSSIGADTARVVERDLRSGAQRVLAAHPRVDAGEVVIHPRRHQVQAVSFSPDRAIWAVVDPAVKADFGAFRRLAAGDVDLIGRDTADRTWLLAFDQDRGPTRYFTWDRRTQRGAWLFDSQPALARAALAPMKPIAYRSRDGLTIPGYLTLPLGGPGRHLPLVIYVHGGPWGRDSWGWEPTVQWLANRGYAVLQPNFRGSTGYGKRFLNAGNREWGRKMHDDLIDGVEWAVREGVADRSKVAIFGGSYGGYATLAGLAFTPEVFACGVDIVGPSNLQTLLGTTPPYWKALKRMLAARVGDVDDPRDAGLLRAASPLFKAGNIRKPLLIAQGANDPRVKQAESEQIVAAIAANQGTATYVLYPDEGHGFARPENRLDFHARAEAFLAGALGGRAEPMAGERHPGSTAVVKVVAPLAPRP